MSVSRKNFQFSAIRIKFILSLFPTGGTFGGSISENKKKQIERIRLLEREMKKLPNEFKNVSSCPTARVPILEFSYVDTDFKCDVSFKSGIGRQNSKLVK